MMRIYEVDGKLYWYEEGEQPECAVEYKAVAEEPAESKQAAPKNKARKAASK